MQTRERIKQVLIEGLNLEGMTPEMIGDDDQLFGEGLGLDSVDALELIVALEKEYGIQIESEGLDQKVFGSIASLSEFVDGMRASA